MCFQLGLTGWKVRTVQCGRCGHKWVSVSPKITPVRWLQCPKCGRQGRTREYFTM